VTTRIRPLFRVAQVAPMSQSNGPGGDKPLVSLILSGCNEAGILEEPGIIAGHFVTAVRVALLSPI